MAAVLAMLLQKVHQLQLGSRSHFCFQSFANDLAADFNSAIVIAVRHVLQQMRHFWERTPVAIFGKVFSPLASVCLGIRHGFQNQILRDTKQK